MKKRTGCQDFSLRMILIKSGCTLWLISLILLLWPASAAASGANPEGPATKVSSAPVTVIQKITVSGTVTTISDNLPLPAASVVEKGTLNATSTDVNGAFTLTVSGEQAVLVVTFIGMKVKEVPVTPGAPMNIAMEEDNFNLEEVIVTGYGSVKKEAYAGSASIIKMESLSDVPVTNLGQLLQGSVSGVQFTNTSGQPGAATQIRIRGTGSFNASNDPLFVVDGVPIISGNISSLGTSSGLDILSTMSPSDIESISIIKDAAAASLYGSRAANGVIVITTKKGSSGAAKVTFRTEMGSSDFATEYRPFMGGQERRETIYDGLINEGIYYLGMDQTAAEAHADANIDTYAAMPWTGKWTDWKSILFRKGKFRNNEISISGGNDKMKVFS